MTLRSILALTFLLACGFPLLLFWLWPHSRALNAELERTHERHLVLAEAAAETLSVYQQNVTATFATIVAGINKGSELTFAQPLLHAQAFNHFCIVDAESGKVLEAFSISGASLPKTLPPGLQAELKRRVAAQSPHLDTIWIGQKGGAQFLMVEDLGDRLVFASINGRFLQRIASSVTFGQQGHMAILDANGRVIAHPDPDWVAEGRDLGVIPEVGDLFDHNEPEVLVFFSPALQEDVVAGSAPVAASGWRVLVPQPMSEVRAAVIAGRTSASFVFSTGLALSALVAMVAATLIARPLRSLAQAADAMARGGSDVRVAPLPRLAPIEIRQLRRSFNRMSRRIEATLARVTTLAQQDPATGLLNKRTFQEMAGSHLKDPDRDHLCALVHVDLNNLKRINDVYGHGVGDEAISHVAHCLQEAFPAPALTARVGGDEFLALVQHMPSRDFETLLRPLIEGTRIRSSGGIIRVNCSIGIACETSRVGTLDLLSDQADDAMYFAKKRGSGLKIYDADLRQRAQRRIELATQLRMDVALDRIDVAFQPICTPGRGEIVAFEALARWQSASFGTVAPEEFLKVAQDVGIIRDLDRCVRRKAFAFAGDLRKGGSAIPVSINVPALDLARNDFPDRFFSDLQAAGLQGGDITVEVTETIFHDRYGLAIDTLKDLHAKGVAIQLDDFGKGFSAHGLLPLGDFDAVKIDMGIAGDPLENDQAGVIVSSLIRLGKDLGLVVVVEGVESDARLDFARAHEADHLQGYLLSPAMQHAEALQAVFDARPLAAAE